MLDPTRNPHVLKARSATSALLQQLDALRVLFPKPDNQGDHEAIADAREYVHLASICLADVGTEPHQKRIWLSFAGGAKSASQHGVLEERAAGKVGRIRQSLFETSPQAIQIP